MRTPLLIILFSIIVNTSYAQSNVTIIEETMALDTYPFNKPNPVPIVVDNPKLPPYYKFEAYAHASEKRNWKVVTLENDHIKVWVLPEIGGKVWGAVEKKTGEEFLYKNEVIKFRNIAMRGPWTSGGIEFNFGIIGHHPSTATAVDYLTRTNADGSVSCVVGNTDLSSNTKWTVEIRLEKDKAYFETNASWYNASPLTASYYNWMTAAAVATDDLEFFIPGNTYVEHNGNAHSWPIDEEGRNLALYKNNKFGPSKSYHIVGEYNDFFGGYYHDTDFGFGTWSPYEEMPGQKLWLWDLSRGGGIWEDLLTDSDGQYIEFQAGRLFDQYFPGAVNPISQIGFEPYVMDTWSEIWFPYKEIKGMTDASKEGVLNVKTESGQTFIGLNALQNLNQEMQLKVNGEIVFTELLNLKPMEVFTKTHPTEPSDKIEVSIIGTALQYTNEADVNILKRPFYSDENLKISQVEELFQAGLEALQYREFDLARKQLSELIALDPSHRAGLTALAELEYRRTNYDKALELCNTVLKMDTYDSGANYIAGISYRALDDSLNALESLGWSARDMKYRSVAFAQMAEINLSIKNYDRAQVYAAKALTFNLQNVNAREVLLVLSRIKKDNERFESYAKGILEIDPLNHFVGLETARMAGFSDSTNTALFKYIKNEFKEESILELALRYHDLGFDTEALLVLSSGPKKVKNSLWAAYLQRDKNESASQRMLDQVLMAPINLVLPYRRETIPVLEWAATQNQDWRLKYYLAHNYLAVGLGDKGKSILKELGDQPDSDVFYRFRAALMKESGYDQRVKDYQKALQLGASDWKVWEEVIQFYLQNEKYGEAHTLSKKAYRRYKNNYNIELAHAKAALHTDHFSEVLKVLKKIQVLPYEHASESREIYERAHLAIVVSELKKNRSAKALSLLELVKEWPENIGVGKPYSPDERPQDYLLALTKERMGENDESRSLLKSVVTKTEESLSRNTVNHLFGLLAAKKLDDGTLDRLLLQLEESASEDGQKSKLALALYQNEKEGLQMMESRAAIPSDVKEMLAWVLRN